MIRRDRLGLVLEGVNQEVNKSRTSLYPHTERVRVGNSPPKAARAVLLSRPHIHRRLHVGFVFTIQVAGDLYEYLISGWLK